MNITNESNHIECKADLAGCPVEAQIVKTSEQNSRSGDYFFRVDYLCPIRGSWQFGPVFARQTLVNIFNKGKLPKVA